MQAWSGTGLQPPCCCWPVVLHVAAQVLLQHNLSCASLMSCGQAADVYPSLTGLLMPAGFGATRQVAAVVAAAIRLAALPPSMVNLGWEYPAELLQGSDGALPEVPGDRSAGLHHEVSVRLVLAG